MREVHHALRRLLRAPLFTLPAVLTLALVIGLNAAIFTLVLHVVLAPLPYPDSGRLVALDHGAPGLDRPNGLGMSTGLYAHYSERAQSFESLALHTTFEMNVSGDGEDAERVMVTAATPSLAHVLRTEPRLGRWFSEEEGELGGPRTVVLSHGLWQRRYGGDPDVIGRSVLVGGEPAEIVGVMSAYFRYPDVWSIADTKIGRETELWLSGLRPEERARLQPRTSPERICDEPGTVDVSPPAARPHHAFDGSPFRGSHDVPTARWAVLLGPADRGRPS